MSASKSSLDMMSRMLALGGEAGTPSVMSTI